MLNKTILITISSRYIIKFYLNTLATHNTIVVNYLQVVDLQIGRVDI